MTQSIKKNEKNMENGMKNIKKVKLYAPRKKSEEKNP